MNTTVPNPTSGTETVVVPDSRPLATLILLGVNGGVKVQRGAAADGRPKWATPLV